MGTTVELQNEIDELIKYGCFYHEDQCSTRVVCNCCGAFSFNSINDINHDKDCICFKYLIDK